MRSASGGLRHRILVEGNAQSSAPQAAESVACGACSASAAPPAARGRVRAGATSALNGSGFAFLGSLERVVFASIDSDRYEEELWQSALIGAAGGALIGVAVGALRPQERWERLRRWRDE